MAGWYHNIHSNILKKKIPCFGFHASLLPELKGQAPLNWAIINNFNKTGVSLFQITEDIDSGKVLAQEEFKINKHDYIMIL